MVRKGKKAALGTQRPGTSLPSLPYQHSLRYLRDPCPAQESPSGDVLSSPTQLFFACSALKLHRQTGWPFVSFRYYSDLASCPDARLFFY